MSETVLIIIVVSLCIVLGSAFLMLVGSLLSRPLSGRPGVDEILRERYARGEITRDQYDQLSHDLK